jgi:NADH dehydrogenase FAD-containing subunit
LKSVLLVIMFGPDIEVNQHKSFIPYTKQFENTPNKTVNARVDTVEPSYVTLDRPVDIDGRGPTNKLDWDFLVLATGTVLPSPGTLQSNTKSEGVTYFKHHQKAVADARRIIIVGGGAVGIRRF